MKLTFSGYFRWDFYIEDLLNNPPPPLSRNGVVVKEIKIVEFLTNQKAAIYEFSIQSSGANLLYLIIGCGSSFVDTIGGRVGDCKVDPILILKIGRVKLFGT